jgi:hypothetical protein
MLSPSSYISRQHRASSAGGDQAYSGKHRLPKNLLHISHTKSKRVRIIPLNETAFQTLRDIGPELFSHLNMEIVSRTFGQH